MSTRGVLELCEGLRPCLHWGEPADQRANEQDRCAPGRRGRAHCAWARAGGEGRR